jgi:hypothetical protein
MYQMVYDLYLSVTCQKADWKVHKRSACLKPAEFHKLDKMWKRFTRPNTTMGRLGVIERAAWEARRLNPTPATKCDGCLLRFRGAPVEEDGFDYGEEKTETGDMFKRCTDCDFTICEDCSMPENQGEFQVMVLFLLF